MTVMSYMYVYVHELDAQSLEVLDLTLETTEMFHNKDKVHLLFWKY